MGRVGGAVEKWQGGLQVPPILSVQWGRGRSGSRSGCTSVIWGKAWTWDGCFMYCKAFGLDVLEDSGLKIK